MICLNDGTTYPSGLAAAAAYGVDSTSVSAVCRRRPKHESVNGLVFRFVGDAGIPHVDVQMVGKRRLMRPVVCCSDGKRYDGIGEAAAAYGVSLGAISNVLRGKAGTAAGGRMFRYADDPLAAEIVPAATERRHSKRIVCENDGREFPSASEAGRAYNMGFRVVSAIALGNRSPANGLVFRYVE